MYDVFEEIVHEDNCVLLWFHVAEYLVSILNDVFVSWYCLI